MKRKILTKIFIFDSSHYTVFDILGAQYLPLSALQLLTRHPVPSLAISFDSTFQNREILLSSSRCILISLAIVFCRCTGFRLIRARTASTTFFVHTLWGCPLLS